MQAAPIVLMTAFTVFTRINDKLKPLLHIFFSCSKPCVSEDEEGSIIDIVLLVHGVSENDSSRMTQAHLRNSPEPRCFLWGVLCLVLLWLIKFYIMNFSCYIYKLFCLIITSRKYVTPFRGKMIHTLIAACSLRQMRSRCLLINRH